MIYLFKDHQTQTTLNLTKPSKTMTTWGDLSESQRNYHITFSPPPMINNQPQYPGNNDVVYDSNPTLGEINAVIDTGDDLVRTINYNLSDTQEDAVCQWIIEHGSDDLVTRLAENILDLRPLPIEENPTNIPNNPEINDIPDIPYIFIYDDILNDINAVEDMIDGINEIYGNFHIY